MIAGMPIVRARIAVSEFAEPPAVIKPRISDLSSCTVSLGARSSAATMHGTSDTMPLSPSPVRMPTTRVEISRISAARACM